MTYTIRRAVTGSDLADARRVVLQVAERDLGYGYTPQWHWDLDRMGETYVDNDRQAMLVAVDASGGVVATAAIRIGGPASPPHAAWLADRYADRPTVGQLLRLATLPQHRRRGIARRLVAACVDFVRADGQYKVLCLHTNTKVPGAEAFWRSLPVVEVHDARSDGTDSDPRFETVHFELPLDVLTPRGGDQTRRAPLL
jgi:GNAT superfamily N-acetyltransferase